MPQIKRKVKPMKKKLAKWLYKLFRPYIRFETFKSPIMMAVHCKIIIFEHEVAKIRWTNQEIMEYPIL